MFVGLTSVIAISVVLSWKQNWVEDPTLPRSPQIVTSPSIKANVSTTRNSIIERFITDGATQVDRVGPTLAKTVSGTGMRAGYEEAGTDEVAGVTQSNYFLSKRTSQTSTQSDKEGVSTWQERNYLYSDETFFYAIHAISPNLERFLSHRAYMVGHQIETDEVKVITDTNAELGFIMGMQSVCPECVKGLIFYEKNIAGHVLTVDEYRGVLNQPNFNQMIEASNADDYVVSLFEE